MRYLGLDLGTKSLGLALSDRTGLIASFYKNISYTDENKLIEEIKDIVDNYKNIYSKSKDYIIIIRKSCLNEAYSVLEDNLGNLLQKLEKEMKNEEK